MEFDLPPAPSSLEGLVAALNAELGEDGLTDLDERRFARVKHLMESYKSNDEDWQKYANFDSHKYTRNFVDDGNGKFNLLVLAWGEGHASGIHDHSGSHCLMKLLDGTLTESQYRNPINSEGQAEGPLVQTKVTDYERDQVAYINDSLGLHRVENKSHTKGALSLHLYTPPYSECRMFNEQTGQPRASGKMTYYTVRGERVHYS